MLTINKAFKLLFLLATISFTVATTPSQAAKFGSRQEAIQMTKDVIQFFRTQGEQKAIDAITIEKRFRDRDLYPFIIDMNGVMVAHGALRALNGKNMNSLVDKEGVFIIREFVKLMKSSKSGWVDYKWPNFVTGKLDQKSSYLERINNEYFVGVGVYLGTE